MEDRDPPKLLFVDEKGRSGADGVPYLSQARIKAEGATATPVGGKYSGATHQTKSGVYSKATVLLAPYRGDNSRGHVNIDGQVMAGPSASSGEAACLPSGKALTQRRGGLRFPPIGNTSVLIHNDFEDSSKSSRQEFNIQKDIDEGRERGRNCPAPAISSKSFPKTENNSVVTVT